MKEKLVPKPYYIQVDENSFIICQELEDLARRVGKFIDKRLISGKFIKTLQSLEKDLLIVSKLIKEGKTWK